MGKFVFQVKEGVNWYTKKREWRSRIASSSGECVWPSSEGHTTKFSCKRSINSLIEACKDDNVEIVDQD